MTGVDLGIVGGLGPLASHQFVATIYRFAGARAEQQMPRLLLLSDPTFPDRTRALTEGRAHDLVGPLAGALKLMRDAGAPCVVVGCMTIHAVRPLLPPADADLMLDLVSALLEEIAHRGQRTLILCTRGARAARVFESSPSWSRAAELVAMPDDDDQVAIHESIYALKRSLSPEHVIRHLDLLAAKYGVEALASGCTEFHIVRAWMETAAVRPGWALVDPLWTLAARVAG